jgi:hypothetical protein
MRSDNFHIKTSPSDKTADFSTQTTNARRAWNDICQVLKENKH